MPIKLTRYNVAEVVAGQDHDQDHTARAAGAQRTSLLYK